MILKSDGMESPAISSQMQSNPMIEPIAITPMRSEPMQDTHEAWISIRNRLKAIEALHERYNDAETPRLSDAVLRGARRLIPMLEHANLIPPSAIHGTCDSTITLEWHDFNGVGGFRSIDILSEDLLEEFVMEPNGMKTIQTVNF